MTPEINRRKTAMVLHELESSLGNYVVTREIGVENISDKLINEIAERELSRNRAINTNSIKDIVESTYLDEIFQIALDITKDTSNHKYLKKLKELFVLYDIHEIRNVISHPNRKFIDTYWYKVAALSSDPIIDILGIDEVKKALIAAENGEIEDPPEDWFSQFSWAIPNNLPDNFEHAITGLVGRDKEEKGLLECLKNPRINTIAIVAPGGLGKTALALDLINDQIPHPETKEWCDACLFISMKTERLTETGLKKLDAIETIEEIKEQLTIEASKIFDENIESFEELTQKYSNNKILLFIDNLETLLVDSPKDFDDFNVKLPPQWRVLVTSRIAISNASIITLDPLREKSATHMAAVYAGRRGSSTQAHDAYKNIAKKCHCNPLAIRLSVDLFISGKEIPDSIDVANKEIASFSYNNLIESLSKNCIKILEALFVDDNSSRLDLCEILEISRDELALGISELANTSLISRLNYEDEEKFSLNSSVRELLITNPRNIAIRSEIQSKINKRKVLALEIDAKQEKQNLSPYHWNYIPNDTNENLKILLTEINNASKRNFGIRNDKAVVLYKKLREQEHIYGDNYLFQRAYARILASLNAKADAINHYNRAIDLNREDPVSKIFLAILHHNNSEFEEAESIYKRLIDEGWDRKIDHDNKLAYLVVNGYYLSLLFGHKYEDILENTKEWRKSENFRGLLGAYRASAWKRKSESVVNSDSKETIRCLTSAIRILDDVFRNDGYIKSACVQAKNIYNEIAYCLVRKEYRNNEDFSIEALEFIEKHIHNTLEYANYNENDSISSLLEKLAQLDVPNNPFKHKNINRLTIKSQKNSIDLQKVHEKGLIELRIKRIPVGRNGGPNTFIFAEDSFKEEYFLHYDQLVDGGWPVWANLRIGDSLAVKPSNKKENNGRAKPVTEIHLIKE